MRLWIGLLALCGSMGAGQSAGQSMGRIEGLVLNQNGEGVRKATVRLQGYPPQQSGQVVRSTTYIEISDATGRFVFDDLPAGRFILTAQKAGFTSLRNSISNSTIILQAGEVKKDVQVKLVQQGVISGRVTDQAGDAVSNVQVQALHVQYNGARRQLTPFTSATTDDQGDFRIANVEPGRYYLMVDDSRRLSCAGNPSGDERRGRTAQEVDVTTFYPSVPDFTSAVAVDVGAGKEASSVNIRMFRGRVFSIRGSTVDDKPAGSLQLTLTPKSSGIGMANNRIGGALRNGTFEFCGLLPGTYMMLGQRRAISIRDGDAMTSTPSGAGRLEIIVANSNVDGVVFALSPQGEITGRLQMEEGGLPALRAGGIPSQIVLADSEDFPGGPPAGQVSSDGTFRIQNVGLSRYWVTIAPLAPGTYVKSIRFGGQDATNTPVDVTSGAGGVMDVVLSPKAAEVNAIVHNNNGEVASGVVVSIWPKTSTGTNPARFKTYTTGSSGNVKLSDLPPGDYYMAAWEEIDPNLTRHPEFLARFNDQASAVKLGESDKITTDLTLIPKDKIAAEAAKLP